MSLILHEFNVLYQNYTNGRAIDLPPVIPYAHYIEWLEKRGRETHEAYWKNYLSGYEHLATLSGNGKAAITRPRFVRGLEQLTLSKAQTSGLRELSRQYGVTMNTLLQAAWGILLCRYNNVSDVVFGSVVSGRLAVPPACATRLGGARAAVGGGSGLVPPARRPVLPVLHRAAGHGLHA